ncbi:MAG: hypothetical protein ACREPX_10310 [Rhodanobacteraceae bacterium]
MDSPFLTQSHVVISLIGILSGLIVLYGLLKSDRMPRMTLLFLVTTILTSVTGFIFFKRDVLMPSHITGIISLVFLALAVFALYIKHFRGGWRATYVVAAVISLYLNVFVLVVQGFIKVPALNALAPTQAEPPFAIAHGCVLVLFIVLGVFAVRRFRPVV